MEIKLGWSAEINGSWDKMDIILEEIDLAQHLADNDIVDPVINPVEKFKLLNVLGEILVEYHKMSRHPEVFGKNRAAFTALLNKRDLLTAEIKERSSE